jgi:hypothetical protein
MEAADALEKEVQPLRAAALAQAKATAAKLAPGVTFDACETIDAVHKLTTETLFAAGAVAAPHTPAPSAPSPQFMQQGNDSDEPAPQAGAVKAAALLNF